MNFMAKLVSCPMINYLKWIQKVHRYILVCCFFLFDISRTHCLSGLIYNEMSPGQYKYTRKVEKKEEFFLTLVTLSIHISYQLYGNVSKCKPRAG